MSTTNARAFREAVEPYATSGSAGVTKLSISLPTDLVDLLRASAAESGTSVSALIAATVRRTVAAVDQQRTDAALAAQNEENAEFARAYATAAARLLADVQW